MLDLLSYQLRKRKDYLADKMKAEKAKVERMLKTARGQIDGILRMVEDDRYCIDISTQLLASEAMLKRVNQLVLQAHLQGCVKEALQGSEEEIEKKVNEIIRVIEKMNK